MFLYKVGEVETKIPWKRPNKLSFTNWLEEWQKTPGLSNYKAYLCGTFLQNYLDNSDLGRETCDIDVFLTGKITNYEELKNILTQAQILGFKNELLIDIGWIDKLYELNLEYEDNLHNVTYIKNYKKIVKKSPYEEYEYESPVKVKELIPGLYEQKGVKKSNYLKFKDKHLNGNHHKIRLRVV